jgi:hypothetical protein
MQICVFFTSSTPSTRPDATKRVIAPQTLSNMLQKEEIKPSICLQQTYNLIRARKPPGGGYKFLMQILSQMLKYWG